MSHAELPTHPICPYCSNPAVFFPTTEKIYRGKDYGPAWVCDPCQAWVGCHKPRGKNPGIPLPLGRLANADLRKAKVAAHAAFDPLWKAKMAKEGCPQNEARGKGYAWPAGKLGMAREDCHIGMMDVADCLRVVDVCRRGK